MWKTPSNRHPFKLELSINVYQNNNRYKVIIIGNNSIFNGKAHTTINWLWNVFGVIIRYSRYSSIMILERITKSTQYNLYMNMCHLISCKICNYLKNSTCKVSKGRTRSFVKVVRIYIYICIGMCVCVCIYVCV